MSRMLERPLLGLILPGEPNITKNFNRSQKARNEAHFKELGSLVIATCKTAGLPKPSFDELKSAKGTIFEKDSTAVKLIRERHGAVAIHIPIAHIEPQIIYIVGAAVDRDAYPLTARYAAAKPDPIPTDGFCMFMTAPLQIVE